MANETRDRLVEIFKKIEYTPFSEMTMKSNLANQFTDYALYSIVDSLIENGVVVPPCKVGDTVYEIIAYKNKANGNRIDGHICPCVVKSIHLSDRYSKKDEPYITLGAGGNYLHGAYIKRVSIDEFGKSIFPSEEQAEQKLKEMRDNNGNL